MLRTIYGGDIFASDAQALVIPVNCIGVMGAGLARDFREQFPAVHQDYLSRCAAGEIRLGEVTSFVCQERHFVYFPTKDDWRNESKLEDIRSGARALGVFIRDEQLEAIAIPAVGCGLGGLSWSLVEPTLRSNLQHLDTVDIQLYAPPGQTAPRGRTLRAHAGFRC